MSDKKTTDELSEEILVKKNLLEHPSKSNCIFGNGINTSNMKLPMQSGDLSESKKEHQHNNKCENEEDLNLNFSNQNKTQQNNTISTNQSNRATSDLKKKVKVILNVDDEDEEDEPVETKPQYAQLVVKLDNSAGPTMFVNRLSNRHTNHALSNDRLSEERASFSANTAERSMSPMDKHTPGYSGYQKERHNSASKLTERYASFSTNAPDRSMSPASKDTHPGYSNYRKERRNSASAPADRYAGQGGHATERISGYSGQMERHQSLNNPMERGSSLYNPMERRPSFSNPMERRPSFSNQMERGPSFSNQMERRPSFSNQMERRPSFSNQMERLPNFSNQMERRPSFSTPIERRPSYGGYPTERRPSYGGYPTDRRPSYGIIPVYDRGKIAQNQIDNLEISQSFAMHFSMGGSLRPRDTVSITDNDSVYRRRRSMLSNFVGPNFRVERLIGYGNFGQIHLGRNVFNDEPIAIKLEPKTTRFSQLQREFNFYLKLGSETEGIPIVHSFGGYEEFNALVMELLGPNLAELFAMCHRKFSLKSVFMIALQALRRMQFLHAKNILYRDIKPENFVIGSMEGKQHIIYLIDYGLSKEYIDPSTNAHIPLKDNKGITGTVRYVSINMHQGKEVSRRDDLEALGYMLMYFLRGRLPWQGLGQRQAGTNVRDRESLMLERVYKVKLKTKIEDLCYGYPSAFATFLRYTRSLGFIDAPNYRYLFDLFEREMASLEIECDWNFDWIGSPDLKRTPSGVLTIEGATDLVGAANAEGVRKKMMEIDNSQRNFQRSSSVRISAQITEERYNPYRPKNKANRCPFCACCGKCCIHRWKSERQKSEKRKPLKQQQTYNKRLPT